MDYSKIDSWVMHGCGNEYGADVFVIPYTALVKPEHRDIIIADPYDHDIREAIMIANHSSFGLYGDRYNVYTPYYHQLGFGGLYNDRDHLKAHWAEAYSDIRDAFRYYLDHLNEGRSFFIFGHSQGAYLGRILTSEFYDEIKDRLICSYLLGWCITDRFKTKFPNIKPAKCYNDLATVVAFNVEWDCPEDLGYCSCGWSTMIGEGVEQIAINPISWRVDYEESKVEDYRGYGWTEWYKPATYLENLKIIAKLEPDRNVVLVKIIDDPNNEAHEYFKQWCDKRKARGDLHFLTYSMFYFNLRKNFDDRYKAWLNQH